MQVTEAGIPPSSGFHLTWTNQMKSPFPHVTRLDDDLSEIDFYFSRKKLHFHISAWGRSHVVVTPDRKFMLVLHGQVYEPSVLTTDDLVKKILPLYRANTQTAFARCLRGSYVMVIVDVHTENVVLVTDRSGTRKVFYQATASHHWLGTTTADLHVKNPDPAGIASMMINDFCFGGRTVISDVSLLDRASVHSVEPDGLKKCTYWAPDFNAKNYLPEPQLEDAYEELMRQAIRRTLPPSGPLLVSLSGGVDSRAILGILASTKGSKERLTAFTYGDETDDDVKVARELCIHTGVPHKVLHYNNNIIESIKRNGSLSEGIVSFYTHGLDGLFALERRYLDDGTMFVGDIAFRQGKSSFKSIDDMLTHGVGIHSPIHIPRWFSYGNHGSEEIAGQLTADIARLKQRLHQITDLADANHYLLLDQRQNFQILPWREFYTARFIRIANPLIDEDILEFAASVPPILANDKRLHRQTVNKILPELSKIRYATSGIRNRRAFADIVKNHRSLLTFVDSFRSSLDEIVPPKVIKAAIVEHVQARSLDRFASPKAVRNAIDSIRWKLSGMRLRSIPAKAPGVSGKSSRQEYGIPKLEARQLLKLLSLRYFFRE